MRDIIICLLIWHKFPNFSARRAKGFLELLKNFKIINVKIPCFKTLCNYRENNILLGVLDKLIIESSKPLAIIENNFATDSTGIRTKLFSTWYSLRCKKRIRRRDHLTDHISIGTKSKIVTAVDVRIKRGDDNKIFREHVDKTSENFDISEWFGDGMYWAKENCRKISSVGGKPYFKCKISWNGKQDGFPSWREMNKEFIEHPRKYKKHYNKRSTIESANHSKKLLFGDKVYSKYDSSRINEENLRWINYNINVLNRAMWEWKIVPEFMA